MGELIGNLYVLKSTTADKREFHTCNLSLDSWHHTLGHASISPLKHLAFLNKACTGSDIDVVRSCEICFKAKHHRLPFGSSTIHTIYCFELIHIDV